MCHIGCRHLGTTQSNKESYQCSLKSLDLHKQKLWTTQDPQTHLNSDLAMNFRRYKVSFQALT